MNNATTSDTKEKEQKGTSLDFEAFEKRYNRRRFRDLRNVHALIHCREDYLKACWSWLYGN